MNQVYANLADLGKTVEEAGVRSALPTMEAKGAEAVSQDPETGEISIKPRIVFNALDQAWNHGMRTAAAVQADGSQDNALLELSQQHLDDPNGFRLAGSQLVKDMAANEPIEIRGGLLQTGLQKVNRLAAGIQTDKIQRDLELAHKSVQSQIDFKKNQALQLARSGAITSQPYLQLVSEVDSLYGSLEGNHGIAFSADQHHAAMAEFTAEAKIQALLGNFNFAMSKNGTAAAMQAFEAAVNDPNLGLDIDHARAFTSQARQMVNEYQAAQDHADAVAQRNLRQTYDATEKDGIELQARGALTQGWVLANKSRLDPSAFAALLRMTAGGSAHDDPATVAALLPRIYGAGDPSAKSDVAMAAANGRLTTDTATKFFGILNQSVPPDVKRWQSYIVARMSPSTLEGKFDPDAADRQQSALQEYRDFAIQTPNATAQQLRQRADDILAIHSLGGLTSSRLGSNGTRVPLLVGTLENPNVSQSATRIKQRYLALHNYNIAAVTSDPNFQIDMRRLMEVAERADYLRSIEQGNFNGGQP
jgi:hypothetical protein